MLRERRQNTRCVVWAFKNNISSYIVCSTLREVNGGSMSGMQVGQVPQSKTPPARERLLSQNVCAMQYFMNRSLPLG